MSGVEIWMERELTYILGFKWKIHYQNQEVFYVLYYKEFFLHRLKNITSFCLRDRNQKELTSKKKKKKKKKKKRNHFLKKIHKISFIDFFNYRIKWQKLISLFIRHLCKRGCPRGVMVKAMDCGIVISEFVFQSRYYVHFRANTLGKGMNPLILPGMG